MDHSTTRSPRTLEPTRDATKLTGLDWEEFFHRLGRGDGNMGLRGSRPALARE